MSKKNARALKRRNMNAWQTCDSREAVRIGNQFGSSSSKRHLESHCPHHHIVSNPLVVRSSISRKGKSQILRCNLDSLNRNHSWLDILLCFYRYCCFNNSAHRLAWACKAFLWLWMAESACDQHISSIDLHSRSRASCIAWIWHMALHIRSLEWPFLVVLGTKISREPTIRCFAYCLV